jgi:hypothetical protein
MSPLADGPPLQRALELLRNLSQLDSAGPKGCAYLHAGFLNGTCAMTIKSAQQFKVRSAGGVGPCSSAPSPLVPRTDNHRYREPAQEKAAPSPAPRRWCVQARGETKGARS